DFADRVCIVSFIFTRCQLSCPRITSVMKSLQARLEGSDVLLVSLSVEPERWWFLTGSRPLIYNLIQRRFKLSVMENPAPEADGKAEAIAHSDRLALVDRGRVVGLFDSNELAALGSLVARQNAERSRAGSGPCPRSMPASTRSARCFSLSVGVSFAAAMPCRVPRPDRTQRPLRPPRCFRFPGCVVISSAWHSPCSRRRSSWGSTWSTITMREACHFGARARSAGSTSPSLYCT